LRSARVVAREPNLAHADVVVFTHQGSPWESSGLDGIIRMNLETSFVNAPGQRE
jgi:hypothetical protein